MSHPNITPEEIQFLEQLCEKYKNQPLFFHCLGEMYDKCDEEEKSEQTIKNTLERFPHDIHAHVAMAKFHLLKDQTELAEKVLENKQHVRKIDQTSKEIDVFDYIALECMWSWIYAKKEWLVQSRIRLDNAKKLSKLFHIDIKETDIIPASLDLCLARLLRKWKIRQAQ